MKSTNLKWVLWTTRKKEKGNQRETHIPVLETEERALVHQEVKQHPTAGKEEPLQ